MKYKKIILALIILVVGIGAYNYISSEFNRKSPSMTTSTEDFEISSIELLNEYGKNQSKADKKYLGKIILLSGNIKSIETDEKGFHTLVLGDSTSMSSVRSSMDNTMPIDTASLPKWKRVVIRGECTGFNPDEMGLGADIVLNRCVIINK